MDDGIVRWIQEGLKGGALQKQLNLRIRLSLTGVKNPKNREKRVSESKHSHFSPTPEKGLSSQKNPHFYTGHHRENGDLLTREALFWGGEEMGVL